MSREGRRLKVIRTAAGVWVGWPGGAKFFAPERPGSAAGEVDGSSEVRAPMTARVVEVAARPGSEVGAGDVLVILQAMKMEYRLTSPRAGTIERIHCAAGEMVDLGATLVTLAPAGEASAAKPGGRAEGPA